MRINRKWIWSLSIVGLLSGWAPATFGQTPPVAKEVTATREIMALSYPENQSIDIKLQGTYRLPRAEGEAKVERKKGNAKIEVKLKDMKPAMLFGGDYNTYVFWVVSPEGQADNVGEVILQGKNSKLTISTRLDTFGMFITAEPHFLVNSPSRFVVMENTRPTRNIGNLIQSSSIKYRGFEGVYDFKYETLANMPAVSGEVRADLREAQTAVRLAQSAGAERYAPAELAKARESLKRTEMLATVHTDPRQLMTVGHETVRLAVEAQKLATERAAQAALRAERRAHASETARLKEEAQQAQTKAERAQITAEQRAAQAAEEERLRREAEAKARHAQEQAQQLAAAKTEAEQAAERARRESEEARMQMHQALSRVVQTRETARGLILSLPDILFDFNKATLRPQARETLSKIAGILLVAGGYRLSVEGHTDNIGSEEYNLRLSEKRAQNVRDYLVGASLSPDIITARGFGKAQPVASNTTEAGRRENRRVEIVVSPMPDFRYRP